MLRVDDLHKRFGGRPAVDGLTIGVRRGEVYGLLGPNGAGKTTTLSLIVGLLTPDSGSITIDGVGAPTDPRVRRHLGLAPQSLALYDDLTASENLRLFARLYGLDASATRRRVGELLDFAQLHDRADSRVKTYSGGMKRRLNLALALVHDPPLLLLDEPTVGVDPHSRNAIFEAILALRESGKTVVYTTHYMEEAQRLCDRVGVIDRGRLLAEGTVHDLIETYGGASVVSVERPEGVERVHADRPIEKLPEILASGNVLGVHIERANLETVFLALTGRSLRD
ncbi:MAG: ABC transporter ATP-binding protein [Phycisphaeraceae bacterium]|nr:ABC transporter ATP-binding protein [Phycisphaeraceae bacterium]